jgi:DNA polymerase I
MKMTPSLPVKKSKFKKKPGTEQEHFLVFDLESDGLYDEVTKVFCIVIYDINRKQTFTYGPDCIDAALKHLATADALIGHNIINYDLAVLQKLHSFECKAHIIDTLICTRLIWPKEKLYECDENQYDAVPKGLRGSASLKAWGYRLADNKIEFKDFSEYSSKMLEYCIQDVSVTTKLYHLIVEQNTAESALKLEHDFAIAIEKQIRSGFPFDTDKALELIDQLQQRKQELETELKQVFPPIEHEEWFVPKVNNKNRGYVKGVPFRKVRQEEFNPGSRQQIVERLKAKYNWTPDKTTGKGNPILDDDVLEKLPYPEAKPLAEYMLIKKRLGQLQEGKNAWIKLVSTDSVMHGDVVTNGCITGRCSHRNPNMAQVPAVYSPYGKECRALFYAPDDWTLIGVDAKALELRCLAGYLAKWDDGAYAKLVVDPEVDIHIYNQEMFGVATRDISKRLLYALLYSCGAMKAGTIINPNEKDETVLRQLGSTAINSFMRGVPALQLLKDKLSLNLTQRTYLIGLDGRPLYCRSEYKALNVLLQAAGALIMKQVVINLHNNMHDQGFVYGVDWHQHGFIHDEIQLSCPPHLVDVVTAQALKAFPQSQEFFGFACPIEGDAKTGKTWFDTH